MGIKISEVSFPSFDGMLLRGILTVPRESKAALLMMHGIPSDKNEWGFYSDMAGYFAARGVASLRFDFRGFGESSINETCLLTLSTMVNDIDAAYWKLVEHVADGTAIFAVGTSAGGGVTLKWMNTVARPVAGAFLMAPVLDYEYEVTGARRVVTSTCASQASEDTLQELTQNGKLNRDIGYGRLMLNEAHLFDGGREASQCTKPLTIFQGDADTVVPISITREMIQNSKSAKLVVIPYADHGFAVSGDDDLTDPMTKKNHETVYDGMWQRISHER